MQRGLLFIIVGVLGLASIAFADIPDYMLNVNGTTYCPGTSGSPGSCSSLGGLPAVAGLASTLDTSFPGGTGLGTAALTYNPGPGTYFVNLWLFEQLFPATATNEWGTSVGSPAAGETWQIDVPDSTYAGELGTAGAGTIVANTAANTLSNTNFVPGLVPNDDTTSCGFFTGGAANPNCNDYTSMALGFGFTLAANEQELVTFTVSTHAPASGFYLEQIHAPDKANNTEIDYFFSGTAVTQPAGQPPPPPPVPEPSSWILLSSIVALLGIAIKRSRVSV